MEKIYLVVSSRGDYEDFREKVERAFRNKKEAQMYINFWELIKVLLDETGIHLYNTSG